MSRYRFGLHQPGGSVIYVPSDYAGLSLGVQVDADDDCWITKILYSAPGAETYPDYAQLYRVLTTGEGQAVGDLIVEPETHVVDGWVEMRVKPWQPLKAGESYYAVISIPTYGGYSSDSGYWTSAGGRDGLTAGPITAPSEANAVHQSPFVFSTVDDRPHYPVKSNGDNYGVNVEVTGESTIQLFTSDGVDSEASATVGRSTDNALGKAVIARTRRPIVRLRADWDRDGEFDHAESDLAPYVEQVQIERDLSSSLPSEVTLAEGYASAKLTATLSGRRRGETLGAAEILSPWREDSPLWRKRLPGVDVQCDLGFATEFGDRVKRQHTGPLRKVKPSSADRDVEFEALDTADRLHAPITLPAWAMSKPEQARDQARYITNSQWVIDYCLRRNGIYASPPPRDDVQVSVTGHGSLAPEVGVNMVQDNTTLPGDGTDSWVKGHFGPLAPKGKWTWDKDTDGTGMLYATRGRIRMDAAGHGVGFAAWVYTGDDMEGANSDDDPKLFVLVDPSQNLLDSDPHLAIRLQPDGRFAAEAVGNDDAVQASPDGGSSKARWRYLGVHWQTTADGMKVTVRLDGETVSKSAATGFMLGPKPNAYVVVGLVCPWHNVQVWQAPEPPADDAWPGQEHDAEADLDVGQNWLSYLPKTQGEDAWKTIQKVAAAEFAVVGFDEHGRFSFRTRDNITGSKLQLPRETITAQRGLLSLDAGVEIDSVRNSVSVSTTVKYRSKQKKVWELDDPDSMETPPGTWQYTVDLDATVQVPVQQFIPRRDKDTWDDSTTYGWQAVDVSDSSYTFTDDDMNVTFFPLVDKQGLLVVTNSSSRTARFQEPEDSGSSSDDPQPALRVAGYDYEDGDGASSVLTNHGSVAMYGEQTLELDSSEWRQRLEPMKGVAEGLLAELAAPLPTIEAVTVVGDPRRRLADTVRLRDPQGLMPDMRCTITKITRTLSASDGMQDELTVRPIAPPGTGLIGDPELGVLGSTMILGP